MRVKFYVEVDVDPSLKLIDDDERSWAENDVFTDDGTLQLWSNEINDMVGEVVKISDLEWDDDLGMIDDDFDL